jgi:hypothetical protein
MERIRHFPIRLGQALMSYAIIDFGNFGQALGRAFARNGIEVSVATTRDRKVLHPPRDCRPR